MTGAPTATEQAAMASLRQLIDGYRRSALVHTAAELGLADRLGHGPLDLTELATGVGADPARLRQVLRALVAIGVLRQEAAGRFALTEIGQLLRTGHPRSMHDAAVYFGGLSYLAYAGLPASLSGGGIAFDEVFGTSYFKHLDGDQALAARYHRLVALPPGAGLLLASLFDFTGAGVIVDVGGGTGSVLAEILTVATQADGVLYELPLSRPAAAATFAASPAAARCTFEPGDFLTAVPAGADVYLLSRVLANWPDEVATTILANCRAAMPAPARLLIFELVMPDEVADATAVIEPDLNALAHFGGAVRTIAGFDRLLRGGGFVLDTTTRVPDSAWSLLECTVDRRPGQ